MYRFIIIAASTFVLLYCLIAIEDTFYGNRGGFGSSRIPLSYPYEIRVNDVKPVHLGSIEDMDMIIPCDSFARVSELVIMALTDSCIAVVINCESLEIDTIPSLRSFNKIYESRQNLEAHHLQGFSNFFWSEYFKYKIFKGKYRIVFWFSATFIALTVLSFFKKKVK